MGTNVTINGQSAKLKTICNIYSLFYAVDWSVMLKFVRLSF